VRHAGVEGLSEYAHRPRGGVFPSKLVVASSSLVSRVSALNGRIRIRIISACLNRDERKVLDQNLGWCVLYTALSDHRSRHPRAGQSSVIGGEGQLEGSFDALLIVVGHRSSQLKPPTLPDRPEAGGP
jgi:hypothetical protein